MKQLSLFLALVLVLALVAGCTQNAQPTATPSAVPTTAPAATPAPTAEPTPEAWKPDHSITIVVPFAAGGSTDLLARKLAEAAAKELGVSVVISNVAGGSGTTGTAQVADSPADGYTLEFTAAGPLVTQPSMLAGLPYTLDDFRGIVGVSTDTTCIAVHKDSKYQTIQDLMAEKADILVGNTGKGTLHHLLQLAFTNAAGLTVTDVPFQGGSALWTALLGKQIDVAFGTPAEVVPYVQSGDFRVLAVAAPERMEALKDVPTLKEVGIDVELTLEFFLIAPAGVPDDVAAALEKAFMAAANDAGVVDFVKSIGSTHNVRNGADLMAKLASDLEYFGGLFAAAGITPQ